MAIPYTIGLSDLGPRSCPESYSVQWFSQFDDIDIPSAWRNIEDRKIGASDLEYLSKLHNGSSENSRDFRLSSLATQTRSSASS